jgi:predicted DNA binding CopG/RHH family protein
MSAKIENAKHSKEFLPSPEELTQKTVKISVILTNECVEYFKQEAKKHNSKYQTMIRNLLDKYVQHYKNLEDE